MLKLDYLQFTLINEGRTLFDLTTSEIALVEDIADNAIGQAGVQAQHWLNFAYGYHYIPQPLLPSEIDNTREGTVKKDNQTKPSKTKWFRLQPNPAQSWVAVHYNFPAFAEEGIIALTDMHGRVIKTETVHKPRGMHVWNTNEVPEGIYICTVKVKGVIEYSEKLFITK